MAAPKENKNFFASREQREILLELARLPAVCDHFFLTGGSALAVFYLYHRISNDLDLFTLNPSELQEISFLIRTIWPHEATIIRESSSFVSTLIREVKVDFVHDPLSQDTKRDKIYLSNNNYISIDTIPNIASNKLCTVVSRTEPKDFIDLYFLIKMIPALTFEQIYQSARQKDAIFDDSPTAAFQLEENYAFVKNNPQMMPNVLIDFNRSDWIAFYERIIQWLYSRVEPG